MKFKVCGLFNEENINKVATAIHLRFDAFKCIAIPERIKERLRNSSDHRITYDGIIIIKSQAYRSQERNKQAALRRLKELLVGATSALRANSSYLNFRYGYLNIIWDL